ncbi:MAG: family 65 glycosyl hydrolase [Treponema sp.]|jgi:maltose phosphorylase|nr:family 65 glycosyl hydrolase [Treponema sp.]
MATKYADTYLLCDPWKIIEDGWRKDKNLTSESVFSLGNEYMGARGFAEEGVSAPSLRGCYFNGVYVEEPIQGVVYKGVVSKTHFMVNAVDWLWAKISVNEQTLDIGVCPIESFRRELDMKNGLLTRRFDWPTQWGTVRLTFLRLLDMEEPKTGYQKIVASLGGKAKAAVSVEIEIANTFDTIHGNGKNYWETEKRAWFEKGAAVQAKTKSPIGSGNRLFSGFTCLAGPQPSMEKMERLASEKAAGFRFAFSLTPGAEVFVEKNVYNHAERSADAENVWDDCWEYLRGCERKRFAQALAEQSAYWEEVWRDGDIEIEGDEKNQQGVRFCVFQMRQTYHGADPLNNIGAKGLTGEAYNGHTFWDTETYCLPFFLFSNLKAAKNLLEYRYAGLSSAKERAKQLDCMGACYPIATLNGEEACALWQHASLQFQPSTAVAYGVRHYATVSGDKDFLFTHGVEMLVEISRFLESRGAWNADHSGFGFYAVMGPDEFHMMVNNNCYTNFMAKKTFEYTITVLSDMKETAPALYQALVAKTALTDAELETFRLDAEKMIILFDEKTKLFEQHEGYFALPHLDVHAIPVTDFPLYSHWSYDRIYRFDMLKQPDVLMFLFLFNQDFSLEAKRANYEFYEPRCIHESSLSPSIHSIFASELGKSEEAFRFFGFATRMDLDNYNRNTDEGLHTTSIAAAWVNIVYGFGGLRSDGETLAFNPSIPPAWKRYRFAIRYRGARLQASVSAREAVFESDAPITILVYGKRYELGVRPLTIPLKFPQAQTP